VGHRDDGYRRLTCMMMDKELDVTQCVQGGGDRVDWIDLLKRFQCKWRDLIEWFKRNT